MGYNDINMRTSSDTPEFYIPINKEISQFLQHLRTHSRTIFSAKFGDGKSFFLDKFEKDDSVQKEYKLIKIYPINYQVANNKDIFTLLKYDILLQLMISNIVGEEILREAFNGIKDAGKIVAAFFEGVSVVDPSPKAQIPSALIRALKSLSSIPVKFRVFKGGKRAAKSLLEQLEEGSPFYCEDITTKLIRNSLRDWRYRTNKRVVLIVEDLDRLEPQHLFRILNVFSAHMDYIYRNGEAPADTLVGSRFGFDNIVFVSEYNNLERLFLHFYGDKEAFRGYINKFIPQGFFAYSLRKSANSFFYMSLCKITGMEMDHISSLLSSRMDEVSIRDMAYAIQNVESQILLKPGPDLNTGFLKMLVVMRRIGMGQLSIVQVCEGLRKRDPIQFVRYVIDYMNLDGFSDEKGKLKVGDTTMFYIMSRNQDGFPDVGREIPVPAKMREFDLHVFILKLWEYVIP